jgi:hypothetical protein
VADIDEAPFRIGSEGEENLNFYGNARREAL